MCPKNPPRVGPDTWVTSLLKAVTTWLVRCLLIQDTPNVAQVNTNAKGLFALTEGLVS